MLILKKS